MDCRWKDRGRFDSVMVDVTGTYAIVCVMISSHFTVRLLCTYAGGNERLIDRDGMFNIFEWAHSGKTTAVCFLLIVQKIKH